MPKFFPIGRLQGAREQYCTPARCLPSSWQPLLITAAGAGLFKGNSLTVIKTLPQSAIQFFTYDTAKDLLLAARVKRKGRGRRDAYCEELSQVIFPLSASGPPCKPQLRGCAQSLAGHHCKGACGQAFSLSPSHSSAPPYLICWPPTSMLSMWGL